MALTFIRRIGCIAAALLTLAAPAAAVTTIGGFGLWDEGAAVTAHSAPNAGFAFVFTLGNRLVDESPDPGFTTSAVSAFHFELDGLDVAETLDRVTFYYQGDGGLFDLAFASQTVGFFGDDIGSGGVFHTGFTVGDVGIVDDADSSGQALVVVLAVPEPATWALLITGFALTGAAMRRQRYAPA